jgi:hypothetical protein
MKTENLESIAKKLVAPGKGILAADESSGTIEKRLKSISVPSTEENRRAYREVMFTTAGAGEFISGVILFDETIRQKTSDGRTFVRALEEQGIVPVRTPGRARRDATKTEYGSLRKRLSATSFGAGSSEGYCQLLETRGSCCCTWYCVPLRGTD